MSEPRSDVFRVYACERGHQFSMSEYAYYHLIEPRVVLTCPQRGCGRRVDFMREHDLSTLEAE